MMDTKKHTEMFVDGGMCAGLYLKDILETIPSILKHVHAHLMLCDRSGSAMPWAESKSKTITKSFRSEQ